MDEEIRDKLNILYSLLVDIHQSNVQILKNQKHFLQRCTSIATRKSQNSIPDFQKPEILIEETTDILRQITGGKVEG